MKKSRLFIALLVMFVAASGYAQDSYREAVKEYITLNGGLNTAQQLTTNFKQTQPFLFESSENLDQLTDRYMKEGLVDFMTDVMLPKIKDLGVSEKTLKETNSLLSSPEGRTFVEHSQQWGKAMEEGIKSTLENEFPDPIQPNAGIDAEYVEKFHQVMDANLIRIYTGVFDSYSNYLTGFAENIAAQMPKEMSDETVDWPEVMAQLEEVMAEQKTWMTDNLPTMALNSAYGVITPEDIDFAAKLYSDSGAYNKLLDVLSMVDLLSLGTDIMTNYMEWMQDHGAVLQDGALDIANQMKKMFGK